MGFHSVKGSSPLLRIIKQFHIRTWQEWTTWNYITHEQMSIDWRSGSSSSKTDSTMKPLDHPSFVPLIVTCIEGNSWQKASSNICLNKSISWTWEAERERDRPEREFRNYNIGNPWHTAKSVFSIERWGMTMVQLNFATGRIEYFIMLTALIRTCHVTTAWTGNRLGL